MPELAPENKKNQNSSNFTRSVHNREPDYARETFVLPEKAREKMLERMTFIYGEDVAEAYMPELERILKIYYAHKPPALIRKEKDIIPEERFSEKDIILITYGDLLNGSDGLPLETLSRFCDIYLEGTINTLHILPFFPYSSDRGFSIIDFESVDPSLGTWHDIEDLEGRYQLMFDGVFNHISSKSRWFQEFLDGSPYYKDFFISFDSPDQLSDEDRSMIFRPRTSDILNMFHTINGPKYVWSTFSRDQVDLNFKNPNVLIRVADILLSYVRHGADIIRLDAVTFLWAEPGTNCAHLAQTHEIVKLFRDILNAVAPGVALITETNVPHEENISYFGNGYDEAQMVYNFALPPLVLHTFYTEDSTALSRWAAGLKGESDATTFFNFLDSHDGIGLMAVKNILSAEEIDFIIEKAEEHGALISNRTVHGGSEEPYEINVTWFSALNREDSGEDIAFQVKRFVASRIIAMVIPGVPGIYLHSLIGTSNDIDAVIKSSSKRDINRTVISYDSIMEKLNDPLSKISRINRELGRLIKIRTEQRAFHPGGEQKVLELSAEVFAVLRVSPEKDQYVITLINVTGRTCSLDIPLESLSVSRFCTDDSSWFDLVSGMKWSTEECRLTITLQPYDVAWLESRTETGGDST